MQNAQTLNDRNAWQVPSCVVSYWQGKNTRYCVVIPVINEGERIRKLLQRMHVLGIPLKIDILIVDGGSNDGSLDVNFLQSQGVRALLVKTGPGKLGAQLRCAYAFALDHGYEGIITIDGNNKDDPQAIPNFIDALDNGVDFVQASRFVQGGMAHNTPLLRKLAIRVVHAPLLHLASGFPWTDSTQGFRAYSSSMLRDPRIAPFRDVFTSYELLAYLSFRAPRLGYRCVELPTARHYPKRNTPTKIHGFQAYLSLLFILFRTCLGRYNP